MPRAGLDLDSVVAAAIAVADRVGYDAITLKAVAQSLSIQTPSLYNHVPSLDGLRREIALVAMRRLTDTFARATAGRARDDAVHELAKAYRRFAQEYPALYAASTRAPEKSDVDLRRASDEAVAVVVSVLSGYGFKGSDTVHAARALRATLHGFVDLELRGGFGLGANRAASFELTVDMVTMGLTGMRARSRAGRKR